MFPVAYEQGFTFFIGDSVEQIRNLAGAVDVLIDGARVLAGIHNHSLSLQGIGHVNLC